MQAKTYNIVYCLLILNCLTVFGEKEYGFKGTVTTTNISTPRIITDAASTNTEKASPSTAKTTSIQTTQDVKVTMQTTNSVTTTTIPLNRRYCVTVLTSSFEPFDIEADYKPIDIDREEKKCSVEYVFHKNGTFSDYKHFFSYIHQELPKNITYVGDDKTQWCSFDSYEHYKTKELLERIYCVCEGSMCNGMGSPIHYQLLKMVKDITGTEIPKPLPGFVPTKTVTPKHCFAVFPIGESSLSTTIHHWNISIPYQQLTIDEKAKCSIRYSFFKDGEFSSYVHEVSQRSQSDDAKSIIYVGDDKSQWCSDEPYETFPGLLLPSIYCVCEGSLCNGFGSPIHYQLLKMVKNITGSDFPKSLPGFVHPTTITKVTPTTKATPSKQTNATKAT